MNHKIPNHLQTKDKPYFGLTWGEFLTLIGGLGGAAITYAWLLAWLPTPARLIISFVMGVAALALVFIKPAGYPLTRWIADRWPYWFASRLAVFGLRELQAELAARKEAEAKHQQLVRASEQVFREVAEIEAREYANRSPLVAAWESTGIADSYSYQSSPFPLLPAGRSSQTATPRKEKKVKGSKGKKARNNRREYQP